MGHSQSNQHSNHLFAAFVDWQCPNLPRIDKHIFFLQQTQVDIIKHAKMNNLTKILIFEDDIVLANPSLLRLFCQSEHALPQWDVLGIGINQRLHRKEMKTGEIMLQNIIGYEEQFIKYWKRTRLSYGAFGIGLAHRSFDIVLSAFDFETSGVCNNLPIDNLDAMSHLDLQSINIFPTLILPDVRDSTHWQGKARNQSDWIREHTLIENAQLFSKYYQLRFANPINQSATPQTHITFDHP